MTGTAVGFSGASSFTQPLVMATLAPNVRVHLFGPVWVRADGGLLVPIVKQEWNFKQDGQGTSATYEQVLDVAKEAPFVAISAEVRGDS